MPFGEYDMVREDIFRHKIISFNRWTAKSTLNAAAGDIFVSARRERFCLPARGLSIRAGERKISRHASRDVSDENSLFQPFNNLSPSSPTTNLHSCPALKRHDNNCHLTCRAGRSLLKVSMTNTTDNGPGYSCKKASAIRRPPPLPWH